jgi:hypothetical protein
MTKKSTKKTYLFYGFQYLLDRSIPLSSPGIDTAKNIISSFPNHYSENMLLKIKKRRELIKNICQFMPEWK